MHYAVFLLYLAVLVALPLLALRRWGLLGALVVTVLELAFVGQRRFMVQDPSGILVDVVEQIEPAAGFWDPYVG